MLVVVCGDVVVVAFSGVVSAAVAGAFEAVVVIIMVLTADEGEVVMAVAWYDADGGGCGAWPMQQVRECDIAR